LGINGNAELEVIVGTTDECSICDSMRWQQLIALM